MTTHGLRLRVNLLAGYKVANEDSFLLPIDCSGTLEVSTINGNQLTIIGRGFDSNESALSIAKKLKCAILVWSMQNSVALDVGKDVAGSFLFEGVKESFRAQGIRVIDNVHGIYTFPEDMEVAFSTNSGATWQSTIDNNRFVERFIEAYEEVPSNISEQWLLAMQLFSTSFLDSSQKAQFLNLVTAVECMCPREKMTNQSTIDLVDSFKRQAKDAHIEQAWIQRLDDLKIESNTKAYKRILSNYLPQNEVKKFTKFYTIRSELIHAGRPKKNIDLTSELNELRGLVKSLLTNILHSQY